MIMYGGQKQEHADKLRRFADELEECAERARLAASSAFDAALRGDADEAAALLSQARAELASATEAQAGMKKTLNFGSSPDSAARLMSAAPAYHAAAVFVETTAQHIALLARL